MNTGELRLVNLVLRCLAVFALSVGFARGEKIPSPRLCAGAAIADITPELGSIIIGGFQPTASKHIHDPLLVRALVLQAGAQTLALVVCDNIGLPQAVCDRAKRLTAEKSGIPATHVLIAATHTHSGATAGTVTSIGPNPGRGPDDIAAYQRLIETRIADAVVCAKNQLEPARIGFGRVPHLPFVSNRRWHVSDPALRKNPFGGIDAVRTNPPPGGTALVKPAGPVDPELTFISARALDGSPIALFAVYPLHYVGGVPPGVVSADYFGAFCRRLSRMVDTPPDSRRPPFVAMLANGASGNINNTDFRRPRPARAPFEQIERVAGAVAEAVHRAETTVDYTDSVSLGARNVELGVPARKPSASMVEHARRLLASPTAPSWHPSERSYARRVLQLSAAPPTVPVALQVLRIGNIGILAIPAEPFVEIGLQLKEQSPLRPSIVVGIANGYHGYLPTVAQQPLGGYETWIGTNRLDVAAPDLIVGELLRLARELRLEADPEPKVPNSDSKPSRR